VVFLGVELLRGGRTFAVPGEPAKRFEQILTTQPFRRAERTDPGCLEDRRTRCADWLWRLCRSPGHCELTGGERGDWAPPRGGAEQRTPSWPVSRFGNLEKHDDLLQRLQAVQFCLTS
jgi:hypothetical protein